MSEHPINSENTIALKMMEKIECNDAVTKQNANSEKSAVTNWEISRINKLKEHHGIRLCTIKNTILMINLNV